MSMELKNYAGAGQTLIPTRQTIRERLEEQKRTAAEFLANIEAAIKFMDENPNFEAFHNLVSKIGF